MLEKLFGFDPSKMTLRKEVIGGIASSPLLEWMQVLCLLPHVSRL